MTMDRRTAVNTVYEWAYQVEQEFGVATPPGTVEREVREVLHALGVTDAEITSIDEANNAELRAQRRQIRGTAIDVVSLPQLAPDNWDELTAEQQAEHVRLLRSIGREEHGNPGDDKVFHDVTETLIVHKPPGDGPVEITTVHNNPREDQETPHGTTHRQV